MYYVDTQRTLTRRDSSLVGGGRRAGDEEDVSGSARTESWVTLGYKKVPPADPAPRSRGSTRREVVALLFHAMLEHVVASWTPVGAGEDRLLSKAGSEITLKSKKKTNTGSSKAASAVGKALAKKSKTTTTSSKMDEEIFASNPSPSAGALPVSWFPCPDERVTIVFRNGNKYEGGVSMKAMHGPGRFQWSDGTVYLGDFKDNAITGAGRIQWRDGAWFEGEFLAGLRHGRGLYVDPRRQRCHAGRWRHGTKHGKGDMHFDGTFDDYYKGDWVENVRHGWGARGYSAASEYRGGWERGRRDGLGVMLWDNHDYYSGQWRNGLMSGCGSYIWSCHRNRSATPPALCRYAGGWRAGLRHGLGSLQLGFGARYEGEFSDNKKHGAGQLVTIDGAVIEHSKLFQEDNLSSLADGSRAGSAKCSEPFAFDISDARAGLRAHVLAAFEGLDRREETRDKIVEEFCAARGVPLAPRPPPRDSDRSVELQRFIELEEDALAKALTCYEYSLRRIYDRYATVLNDAEIHFQPTLIRLYMWQFFYDCNLIEKGITLVQLDDAFHGERAWLSRGAHDPFELLQFWQFRHCCVWAARRLYPPPAPPAPPAAPAPPAPARAALAAALRRFMEEDVLPNVGAGRGFLVTYGRSLPLHALYDLYRDVGEPHTLRAFLCATRPAPGPAPAPPADTAAPAPPAAPAPAAAWRAGARNAYDIGYDMEFIEEDYDITSPDDDGPRDAGAARAGPPLSTLADVPAAVVVDVFHSVFPQVKVDGAVADLEIEVTFFEFLQLLVLCAEEGAARAEAREAEARGDARGGEARGERGEAADVTDAAPVKAVSPSRPSRVARSLHAEH